MEGKALHKFLKLILNSTCQIGCFSNAWKLYHRINPGKKSYCNSQSYLFGFWKNCLVGVILPDKHVYKKNSIIFGRWNFRDFGTVKVETSNL